MSYEEQKAREVIVSAGKELLQSGLIARTWGNISARISDTTFLITPSGRDYESLMPEDIVPVYLDGTPAGNGKPSSEKKVHAEAYRLRPDVDFVIHTHQANASALSVLGEDLTQYGSDAATILGGMVPCASYGLAGSDRLKERFAAALTAGGKSQAVLLKNHGAVCLGKTYEDAFRVAKTLERAAGEHYEELIGEALPTVADASVHYRFVPEERLMEYRKAFSDPTIGAVIRTDTPFIKKVSEYGRTMRPYIDDLAQIAGTSVRTVGTDAGKREYARAMRGRAAVLVQGKGALCVGTDRSEAEAVCMVLEKGCQAAYLAYRIGRVPPVGFFSAAKDRQVYVKSYAKLKTGE